MNDIGAINDALNHINYYVGINKDNVAFINKDLYIDTWNVKNTPYKLVIGSLIALTNGEGQKYNDTINGKNYGYSWRDGFTSICLFNNDNFITEFNIVDDGEGKKKFAVKPREGGANKKSKRRTKRSKKSKRGSKKSKRKNTRKYRMK